MSQITKTVQLPSGAVLKIQPAPFADARALYQALLEEARGLRLDPTAEVDANFYKDIFCAGFSSKKVEAAIWKCLGRCLYNDQKMSEDTFEPLEARDDYFKVIFSVAEENVRPFTKNLSAEFSAIIRTLQVAPA